MKPDLIILDITMPLLNGIDAALQIKKSLPGVKLLFVTMHVNPAYLEAALNAGGTGYVLKSAAREELLDAIKNVMNGQIYVTSSLASEPLQRFTDPSRAADVLNISIKTVAFRRDNIKRKLGLRTTAELTKHAIEQGLV